MKPFDAWEAPLDAVRPQNNGASAVVGMGSSWDDFVHRVLDGNSYLTEQQALTVSAIYACVNIIAGALAAIPVNIYSRKSGTGERTQLFDDPLWWVLNEEMIPRWSAAVGWEFMALSLLLQGDAFAQIVRDKQGNARGLKPVHPTRTTVLLNSATDRLVYVIVPEPWAIGNSTETLVLDQDDMIHVPGLGFNGLRGLSPLRYALRNAGNVAMATQDYAARFFKNSSRPDYVLKGAAGAKITPEEIDRLRNEAAEKNSRENAHKPMVLTNGMEYESVSLSPEDTQLILTRNFQIEEIARIYGVPPFMIGHTQKTTSWGTGVAEMGTGFVRYALRQHIHKFEVELNRKLFRTAGKVVQFDTSELERADMKAQFEAFRIALGRAGERPFMTTDEVRGKLSLNKTGELPVNPGTSQPSDTGAIDASQTA